jgi:hypothetical protein
MSDEMISHLQAALEHADHGEHHHVAALIAAAIDLAQMAERATRSPGPSAHR